MSSAPILPLVERRCPAIAERSLRERVQRAEAILSGALISHIEFARSWGLGLDQLEAIEKAGAIFWVEHAGERYCLSALLEIEAFAVTRVCLALGAISAALKYAFWLRRHTALSGLDPVEAIRRGWLREVLALARDWPDGDRAAGTTERPVGSEISTRLTVVLGRAASSD
jgi:hypothetical protein